MIAAPDLDMRDVGTLPLPSGVSSAQTPTLPVVLTTQPEFSATTVCCQNAGPGRHLCSQEFPSNATFFQNLAGSCLCAKLWR